jgi:hypothetical protein
MSSVTDLATAEVSRGNRVSPCEDPRRRRGPDPWQDGRRGLVCIEARCSPVWVTPLRFVPPRPASVKSAPVKSAPATLTRPSSARPAGLRPSTVTAACKSGAGRGFRLPVGVQVEPGRRGRETFTDEGGQHVHDGRMVTGGVNHDAL